MDQAVFYGILIPFLGTSLGAACVFFMKHDMSERLSRILTGFAAGVMVAASIWSLLIPAMDQSEEMGKFAFIPAAAGFWGGILFLLLLDHIIPHLHRYSVSTEGPKSRLQRTTMMVLAVTLHNIPEGMAVGVVYAGYLAGNAKITVAAAMALSIGIAIQNFPEGAIISMPLRAEGMKVSKAFAAGVYGKYKEATGDTATKTVIASTASPFKFTRSVMDAIDPKYDSMTDFELVDELSKLGNVKVPNAIEEIRDAKILHNTVCDVDQMENTVKKMEEMQ